MMVCVLLPPHVCLCSMCATSVRRAMIYYFEEVVVLRHRWIPNVSVHFVKNQSFVAPVAACLKCDAGIKFRRSVPKHE